MKQLTATLFLLMLSFVSFGQDKAPGAITPSIEIPAHIQALYEEGKALDMVGTAEQINQNRLDIIEAWQLHDPEVAALYNLGSSHNRLPEIVANLNVNGYATPGTEHRNPEINENPEWGPDLLVHNGLADGVDMVVNGTDIYIGVYERLIDFGGTLDSIWIYRSTDGGGSFELWKNTAVTAAMRKMQLIAIGPGVDSHICAYLLTASNTFQVFRWKVSGGAMAAQVVDTDVSDFGVDRNYPSAGAQRVFASYLKDDLCATQLYAARSTAGSFGFDWVDQGPYNSLCVEDVDLAYGRDGGVYVTNTGASSGNLYTHVNDNFADPASWDLQETLETGGTTESHDPQIVATRKAPASDEVLVIYSHRAAGNTDGYNARSQSRVNGAAFGSPVIYQTTTQSTFAIDGIDVYSERVNGEEFIQACYVRDRLDGTEEDLIRYRPYNGTGFDVFEIVTPIDVSVTTSPAVAVANGDPILAYISGEITNVYFNAQSGITGVHDGLEELGYSLGQNYPNPVTYFTQFGFHLTEAKDIKIVVTDILGKTVEVIAEESRSAGDHIIYWEPNLSAGTYFYQLQIDGSQITKKMIVK